jgi:hypothetical protein
MLNFLSTAFLTILAAGPFGVTMGQPASRYNSIREYGSKYFVISPPTENSNFVKYTLMATPIHGTCAIFAETQEFEKVDDANDKFFEIAKLFAKYGKSKTVKPGPNWPLLHSTSRNFPKEWSTGLPNNIDSIVLETEQKDNQFKVVASYFFKNFKGCSNWEPKQDGAGI